MKYLINLFFLFTISLGFAQQYDSVKLEDKDIDLDNNIYKVGNVYVFDYEIIENDKKYKLNKNTNEEFEFVDVKKSKINIDKIHLTITPQIDSLRTNENQTQINYFQLPIFNSYSSTGLVENEKNIWLHPIRDGFFHCLETCPFPYVKFPLKKNEKWSDEMLIGEQWGNEKWGKWKGSLLLKYNYDIIGKRRIETVFGKIKCYVIESFAESNIGKTKLVSYYSEKYGFVKYEYTLMNDIKVNIWLVDFKQNQVFRDSKEYFRTKKYLKE